MNDLIRALIAILLGVLVYFVGGLLGLPHIICLLAGLIVGLIFFFGRYGSTI